MPTRIGYPGTIVAADLITAANNNKLPGGLVAYGKASSQLTGIAAPTNLGSIGLSLTYAPVNSTRSLRVQARVTIKNETIPATGVAVTTFGSIASWVPCGLIVLNKDSTQVDAQMQEFISGHSQALDVDYLDIAPTTSSHVYQVTIDPTLQGFTAWTVSTDSYIAIYDVGPSF